MKEKINDNTSVTLRSGNSDLDSREKYSDKGTEKWNIDVETKINSK